MRLSARVIGLNWPVLFSRWLSMICGTRDRLRIGIEQNCRMTSNDNGTTGDRRAITMETYRTANTTVGTRGKSL